VKLVLLAVNDHRHDGRLVRPDALLGDLAGLLIDSLLLVAAPPKDGVRDGLALEELDVVLRGILLAEEAEVVHADSVRLGVAQVENRVVLRQPEVPADVLQTVLHTEVGVRVEIKAPILGQIHLCHNFVRFKS